MLKRPKKFLKKAKNWFIKQYYEPVGAVLMYHRVAERPDGFLGPDEYTVSPDVFEKHIAFLNENFNIIPVHEFYLGFQGEKELPKKPVVITFDDGYRDTYENDLPVLEKLGAPATVFISTGLIEKDKTPIEFLIAKLIRQLDELRVQFKELDKSYPLKTIQEKKSCYNELKAIVKHEKPNFRESFLKSVKTLNGVDINGESSGDKRIMFSWAECEELSRNPLITIGSHGVNHVPLTTWKSLKKQREELKSSKETLEKKLGLDISYFSYPYGDFNSQIVQLAQEVGYTGAFATKNQVLRENIMNRFQISRLSGSRDGLEGYLKHISSDMGG